MTKNLWISLGVKKAATWCITSSGMKSMTSGGAPVEQSTSELMRVTVVASGKTVS
jgi:hypothetical protein